MKNKPKICSHCKKEFPALYKSCVVKGERLKLCQTCTLKLERNVKKDKKEKEKVKRQIKRALITEKKLDLIFSKLVKLAYPPICHSTGVSLKDKVVHAAHLISRNNRCLRWDIRNVMPTLAEENMYNQNHVIFLARKFEEYYNISFDTLYLASKQSTCKITADDRHRLYKVFSHYVDIIPNLDFTNLTLDKIREEIIKMTKFIL